MHENDNFKKNFTEFTVLRKYYQYNTINKNTCVEGWKPGNGIHMCYRGRIFSIRVLNNEFTAFCDEDQILVVVETYKLLVVCTYAEVYIKLFYL